MSAAGQSQHHQLNPKGHLYSGWGSAAVTTSDRRAGYVCKATITGTGSDHRSAVRDDSQWRPVLPVSKLCDLHAAGRTMLRAGHEHRPFCVQGHSKRACESSNSTEIAACRLNAAGSHCSCVSTSVPYNCWAVCTRMLQRFTSPMDAKNMSCGKTQKRRGRCTCTAALAHQLPASKPRNVDAHTATWRVHQAQAMTAQAM